MYKVKDNAEAQLQFGISSVATTLVVKEGQGVKFPEVPFLVVLNKRNSDWEITKSEKVEVSAVSGDQFTISRGYEWTTPSDFSADDFVSLFVLARHITDIQEFVQKKAIETDKAVKKLSDDLTTAEEQIEQIQNWGQTNFLAERELGEDIEAGKAYFLGEGILSTRTINDNTAIKSLLPEISESKPPYLAEEKWTEFDDGEFHWKIEEKPSYNNVSNCHFKNDPSSVYRSGANEYDYTWEVTITLSRIDWKEFFLNYFKFKKNRNARPSAKIDWIKSNGESKVLFNGSTNTDDGNEFSSNAWFYQKYSFKIWHGSYVIYFGFAELWIKIIHKKTIGVSSPLSIIECKKWDNLKFTINKVGNWASVNLHWAINKKINSSSETITHYFKENGYVLIEWVNLGTNTYYTIGELEITRGGEKNKKYKSDSTIDWRNKFLGIEKKWGSKWERTHGIEQGLLKLEDISDGNCIIGKDWTITQEWNWATVWTIVWWYLSILSQKRKIKIDKVYTWSGIYATREAPSSGFIFVELTGVSSAESFLIGENEVRITNTRHKTPFLLPIEQGVNNLRYNWSYWSSYWTIKLLFFIPFE